MNGWRTQYSDHNTYGQSTSTYTYIQTHRNTHIQTYTYIQIYTHAYIYIDALRYIYIGIKKTYTYIF